MNDLSRIQSNITVKSEESVNQYTKPSFPQHHQISPTIFLCVNNHHTTRKYQSHSDREIINISDDDEEEENENTCRNGTSIDDSSDEEEIEVIQLTDDDDEGNDESSGKNMTSTLDKHKINDFHNEFDESSLELTHKNIQQRLTYFEHQSVPPTSQTEHHQPLICPKEGVYTGGDLNISGSIMKSIGLYCPECSILIENRSELDKHLMGAHADKLPFKCMIRGCCGQFTKRFYLDNHYQDYHDTNPNTKWICSSLECKIPKYTKTRNSFMAHVSKYHEAGVFQCAACLAQYPHKYMVYNHHNVAHRYPRESLNKRFRCTWPACEYIFKYMYNAFLHVRTEHLTVHGNVNQKNCDRCRGPIEFVEQIQLGDMTQEARMRQEESRIRREASRIRTKRIQNCRNYRENVR